MSSYTFGCYRIYRFGFPSIPPARPPDQQTDRYVMTTECESVHKPSIRLQLIESTGAVLFGGKNAFEFSCFMDFYGSDAPIKVARLCDDRSWFSVYFVVSFFSPSLSLYSHSLDLPWRIVCMCERALLLNQFYSANGDVTLF